MIPDWSLRAARAAGFASVCVPVSAAAHWYGGGPLLGAGILVLSAALVAAGAFLLSGRERGLRVILPAAFAAQYGLHNLFGLELPQAPQQHLVPVLDPVSGVPVGSGMATMDHAGPAMILAHLIVALLTAAWMRKGETVFCALARQLYARVCTVLKPVQALPTPSRPPLSHTLPVAIATALGTVIAHRGPPAPISA